MTTEVSAVAFPADCALPIVVSADAKGQVYLWYVGKHALLLWLPTA